MSSHKGAVDKTHQIKLPSSIEQVQWTRLRAAPGGTAALEIHTRFVGSGAPLKIQLLDKQGRSHGSFSDKIAGNHFQAEIAVPEKAKKALVAAVKLPKHGLKATSPALLLTPPVTIKNAAWSKNEARRGDVLTLTADVKDAPDGTEAEIVIFEHDADGAHDTVTRFPVLVEGETVEAEWEFEYHEDTDDIPTEEEAEKGYKAPEYFFRISVEGVAAESELLTFKDWIEFKLIDRFGNLRDDVEEVTFQLPDGGEVKKKPSEEGIILIEAPPPGPVRVTECKPKGA